MFVGARAAAQLHSTPAAARGAALTGGARVDVCFLGAGLAELVAAYFLARERRSVIVLHDGPLGGPPSAADLAALAMLIEPTYEELGRTHGAENARLAAQTYATALDTLEAIVRRERIACDLERLDGYRFMPRAEAEREARAARQAGVAGVEALPAPPLEGMPDAPCVRYPAQIQFHPGKLLGGLARAVARQAGRVHNGVRPKAFEAGSPATLVTSAGHRILADHIVMPARDAPRTFAHAIALKLPRGAVANAVYWDDAAPPFAARLRSGAPAQTLLVAGEHAPAALAAWARERFGVGSAAIRHVEAEASVPNDRFCVTGIPGCDSRVAAVSTASWGSAASRAVVAGMAIRDFVVGARVPEIDALETASFLPVREPT